jgi:sugar lactone lactonase YvrE
VPDAAYISVGAPGVAPYLPSNKTYTVMNFSATPVTWAISTTQPWLTVSPSNLVVAGLSSGDVTASIVDSVATGLVEGVHTDTISFEDVTTGQGSGTRGAILRIGDNYAMQSTTFNWVDPITQGHALVGMSGGASGALPIPFDFSLYGTSYPSLYVSSRGYITFTDEGLDEAENADLPSTNAPNALLAPYWDGLTSAQGAGVYIGSIGAPPLRYRVITWLDMAHAEDDGARASFQVLLREAPSMFDDNDIIFQYLDVDEDSGYGAGRSATVGVEGIQGMFFRKYSFDGSQELADGQALLFTMEPETDSVAPTGNVVAVEGVSGALSALYPTSETQLEMEVRFSEVVTGMDTNDFELGGNIPGVTLGELTGSGERYRVTVEGVNTHGFVTVGVKAAAVDDLSGNPNEALGPGLYVVPIEGPVFEDDMESGPDRWTPSEGDFAEYTREGWEFGEPGYISGPSSVPSGDNCWGTMLNSTYSNFMNGWVESDWIGVGPNPVLEYTVWHSIESGYDFGYVEVDNGSGWFNVTPSDSYSGQSAGWVAESIDLDPATFGDRMIRVRFRLLSDDDLSYAGMYVDDVRVLNRKGPGVWVYAYTPTNAAPDSTTPVVFVAYNTDTQTYHDVTADVASLSPGLALSGTVTYGDIPPGNIVTGTTIMASFGEVGLFNDPLAKFSHAVTATEGVVGEEYLPIEVAGVSPVAGSNLLTATSVGGVVDWMGQALRGDGGLGSSLFQVIYAGTNGTPDAPGSGGSVTGDDQILFATDNLTPFGLFGVGDTTPADMGRFEQTFKHGLPSNAVFYVRAWDGPGYAASVAYGDSDPVLIAGLAVGTQDFGSWVVGTPIDLERDFNGDTIPDGYDVLQGRDASQPVEPLDPEWTSVAIAGGTRGDGEEEMEFPGRVVATSNFVFVADTRNDRIQVWSPDLSGVVTTFVGSAGFALNWPEGIALDEPNNRLVVADTKNHRVVLLDLNPVTGALTGNSSFGVQGSGLLEFSQPFGVAVDSSGNIYVADTYNHRVQLFSSSGVPYGFTVGASGGDGQLYMPKGLCVDGGGTIYVADGDHHVQIYDSSGTYVTNFGSGGSAVGEFISPSGVQLGVAGRLVVADQGAHRIQLFGSNYVALAAYKPPAGEMGTLPGQLWLPQGVWPMPDGNAVYVADTKNHRVQLLNMVLDADGDGMNDAWEDANGDCLDSSAADDNGDADGDGLSNVGEFRAGTDPCVADTDGDYVGDLWEMQNGYDPLQDDFDGVILTDLSAPAGHAVQWNVGTGAVYRIEGATDLLIPDWLPLTAITSAIDGLLTWTNAPPPTNDAYFYRVIRE